MMERTMKRTDIIIGGHYLRNGQPVRVDDILGSKVKCGKFLVPINMLEPIPLTREILKNSGWQLVEQNEEGAEHWALIDDCGDYWCELFKISNGYVSSHSFYVGFVHQLQRLLRMYGNFDKKIEL